MSRKLKYIYDADTSRFDRSVKDVKSGLKDLKKTGDQALGDLGALFGVNTGKVEQFAGALGGLGTKLSQSANQGTKAFGNLLSSIGKTGTAVAGLGLAVAVAGFKALNDEADNFFTIVGRGAEKKAGLDAYVSTYRQAMHDINSATGESVANFKIAWKKAATEVGTILSQSLAGAKWWDIPITSIIRAARGSDQASALGEEASRYGERAYKIQRELNDLTVKQAAIEVEIAQQRLIAYDASASTEERQAAISKIITLINKKYEEQIPLEKELADIMLEMDNLAENTAEETAATNAQVAKAIRLEAQKDQEIKAVLRVQNSVTAAAAQEAEERERALQAIREANEARASMAAWREQAAPTSGTSIQGSAQVQNDKPVLAGLSGYEDIEHVAARVVDATALAQQAVTGLAQTAVESLGEMFGALATGGDAWGAFGKAALSGLADLAISVGKIALETGIAAKGIKIALESLQPEVAIAAGAALIALGAAAKAGLANAAKGNYSAGSSVASAAGSYGRSNSAAGDYSAREVTVKVVGQLKADGSQLVAVLDGYENKRRSTT